MDQKKASEGYYSSKSKYLNAAAEKRHYQQAQDSYTAERNRNLSAVSACQSSKLNFEQRIADLTAIINKMENEVPDTVTGANSASSQADASYKQEIQCQDIPAPDLSTVFHCKSVEEDASSGQALQLFKSEKIRLENALQELEQRIQQAFAAIDELTSQIQSCAVHQAELRNVMLSSAYTMEHCRRFM